MLVQLVVAIYVTIRLVTVDNPSDVVDAIKWLRWTMIANIAATGAMFYGTLSAVPELSRMRVDIGGLVISAAGFLIATLALVWSYYVLNSFVSIALDPAGHSLDDLRTATDRLEWLKYVTVTKDLTYGIGLITLLRTVQRSAAASDQLGLRDAAGHQSRMLMVMVAGDLFYQLTYSGGGIGLLGLLGSLLVAGYWIYCHVQLTKFFGNAAYFMNEPHELPVAVAVKLAGKSDKPVAKATAATPKVRPSGPIHPSAPVVAAVVDRPSEPLARIAPPPPPPAPMAPPRAKSADGEAPPDDGPRFLR